MVKIALANIALYCSKAEIRVPVVGGGGWCKPIIMSNPQPSYFGLLLGWVAVAWLGFKVMTILLIVPFVWGFGQLNHSASLHYRLGTKYPQFPHPFLQRLPTRR